MRAEPSDPAIPQETGDTPAGELMDAVYQELRRLAGSYMAGQPGGQTLQATALVNEAWLRIAASGERKWKDRSHFFRTAALAMRQILVDRARHKSSLKDKRPEDADHTVPGDPALTPDDRLLLIHEALELLEKENPEGARIVTMRFFAGMTIDEVAKALGRSTSTIERKSAYARVRLLEIIRDMEHPGNP